MTDLDALRRKAEAATPGPWHVRRPPRPSFEYLIAHDEGPPLAKAPLTNAAYIAAASPDVVLALIERVERAEEIVDAIRDSDSLPDALRRMKALR